MRRVYRGLLRLYPAGYIREYGEEMLSVFCRAQEAARFKSTSTMRLIACASRSSPKPTIFWCPFGSALSVGV